VTFPRSICCSKAPSPLTLFFPLHAGSCPLVFPPSDGFFLPFSRTLLRDAHREPIPPCADQWLRTRFFISMGLPMLNGLFFPYCPCLRESFFRTREPIPFAGQSLPTVLVDRFSLTRSRLFFFAVSPRAAASSKPPFFFLGFLASCLTFKRRHPRPPDSTVHIGVLLNQRDPHTLIRLVLQVHLFFPLYLIFFLFLLLF